MTSLDQARGRTAVSDGRVALLLLDDARHRVVESVVRGPEGSVVARDPDRARAPCERSPRKAHGPPWPNSVRSRSRSRRAPRAVRLDPGAITARNTAGRHSGDDRGGGSAGASRTEPDSPWHQNHLIPSPILAQPTLRATCCPRPEPGRSDTRSANARSRRASEHAPDGWLTLTPANRSMVEVELVLRPGFSAHALLPPGRAGPRGVGVGHWF